MAARLLFKSLNAEDAVVKKLKLVHIVQSLQTGGAERLLVNLAVNCKEQFDVVVISQYEKSDVTLEKCLESHGIQTIFLGKKVGFDVGSMVTLYQTLNKINPDIVHTHLHAAVYAIPWYIRNKDTVKVHTVHSVAPMEFGRIHRLMQGFAYRFLGVVPVAISPSVKKSVIQQYRISGRKIPVILNGIDVSRYALSDEEKSKPRPFTVINVASFNKWKNQMLLLHSFYKVILQYPDVRLIFVGEGAERERVRHETEVLGIADKVLFTGITDHVETFLKKADVFVLSSTFEGLPLSILEAYAAGLPVISTNVGGVRDILEDGVNGFLVPPNDETAMANAIRRVYENPKLREKMSCVNRLKANEFDIKRITEQYIELYFSIWRGL